VREWNEDETASVTFGANQVALFVPATAPCPFHPNLNNYPKCFVF
jgi:hypothetical protein